MKYLVISTRRDNSFESMTVCAEVNDKTLAQQLMTHYNTTDRGQHTEIHPVMNDKEVNDMMEKLYPSNTKKSDIKELIENLSDEIDTVLTRSHISRNTYYMLQNINDKLCSILYENGEGVDEMQKLIDLEE